MAPEFALDATLEERRVDAYTVTKNPIETGAKISDHVYAEPKEYTCSGLITASPLGQAFSKDRIKRQYDALITAADQGTEFTVVFGWDVFDAVLSNGEKSSDQSIGEALSFSLGFTTVTQVQFQTTQIPAIRLKSKVKRRRGKTKKGTAQTPKTPTGKNRKAGKVYTGFKALFGGGLS